MILYFLLIVFLNIDCFGAEQSVQEKQWVTKYSAALRSADDKDLRKLVESPYFNAQYVFGCRDFEEQELYSIDYITFLVRYCKKEHRQNLLTCVDILYNKGAPLKVPNPDDTDAFITSFEQVHTYDEFNYLVTLLAKQRDNNVDTHALGKEILETAVNCRDIPLFLELIRRTIDPLSIISLYKKYRPNVIDTHIFDIIYVSFIKNTLIYHLYQKYQIWTGDDIPSSLLFYPDFLICVVPFFIAQKNDIFRKNQCGFTPNDLKKCCVTWCKDGYPHTMGLEQQSTAHIIPPMVDKLMVQNSDITYIVRVVKYASELTLNLQDFIKMMDEKIPDEDMLIKSAITTYNADVDSFTHVPNE